MHTCIGFQFDVCNTLNDQLLENVFVTAECTDGEGWEVESVIPIAELLYSKPETAFVLLRMPEDSEQITGSFDLTLQFQVRDVDPATGEPESDAHYDDTYSVGSYC